MTASSERTLHADNTSNLPGPPLQQTVSDVESIPCV